MDFNAPRASSSLQAKAITFNKYKIIDELRKSFSKVSWIRDHITTTKYPRFPVVNFLVAESNPDFIRTKVIFAVSMAYYATVDAYKNQVNYRITVNLAIGLTNSKNNNYRDNANSVIESLRRQLDNLNYDGVLKSKFAPSLTPSTSFGIKETDKYDTIQQLSAHYDSVDDEIGCIDSFVKDLGVIFEKKYDVLLRTMQAFILVDKTKLDWSRDYTLDYDMYR